jgi:hypothetical protein
MKNNLFYEKEKHYGNPAFRFSDRTLAISKLEEGNFLVEEECDNYFKFEISKEDLIEGLQKAIKWVEDNAE